MLWRGRGARFLPEPYSSVVTLVIADASRPRATNTSACDVSPGHRWTSVADVVGAVRRASLEQMPDRASDLIAERQSAELVMNNAGFHAAPVRKRGHGADEVRAITDHPAAAEDIVRAAPS